MIRISILVKIFIAMLMGFYINKKTFDPIEYFSRKPHMEILKRDDECELEKKRKQR